MLLSVNNIRKAFGEEVVLDGVSFQMNEHDKTALIGRNGAGKTTLIRIILGELRADEGDVILPKDVTVGYLSQHQDMEGDRGIYDTVIDVKRDLLEVESRLREVEEEMKHLAGDALTEAYKEYERLNHRFEQENGYALRSEVTGIIKGLGFSEEEFDKPVSQLSGGQKTRVALARILLSSPKLLILDEPTNHLDMASIAWLEGYLAQYRGAVLVVSHDRYFLNRIVNRVVEIEHNRSMTYLGNYDEFYEKKAQVREAERRRYVNQQREIKHQEEVIAKLRSFNREKSIKRAESREKMLEKIERVEKPLAEEQGMRIRLVPRIESGKDVLTVTGLTKSFPGKPLFHDISFLIKKGERVALLGENGTGKTTMLKIIRGLLPADAGTIREGAKVSIGYYDQEQQNFNESNTVFGEISDDHPNMNNTEIRNTLALFLFTGEDVFKPISALSGGERGRLSLVKLMLSEANFLLLDEPTNHLDITSKEILEEALRSYEGTVFYVSHDRYFVDKTATRILDLTHETIISYEGNYTDYLAQKERKEAVAGFNAVQSDSAHAAVAETVSKQNWKDQKAKEAEERKLRNRIAKLEEQIASCEQKIQEIDEAMQSPEICTNSFELNRLTEEKASVEETLLLAMTEWEELQSNI
ncbi:MAG: ABC-F family ATP-binding cassette domain-containing protein [Lachnospiraceae bacterium]|nr:ABC-F family ATP-binding cassette domain-containing protein [Lachnospiraceae bacterium]